MLASKSSESGSAALDFLVFGIPGALFLLICGQITFAGYLNTVAFDAAAEAAGVASLADGSEQAAQERALKVVNAVSGIKVAEVAVTHNTLNSWSKSVVTVSLKSSILAFGTVAVTQSAQAIDEPH